MKPNWETIEQAKSDKSFLKEQCGSKRKLNDKIVAKIRDGPDKMF